MRTRSTRLAAATAQISSAGSSVTKLSASTVVSALRRLGQQRGELNALVGFDRFVESAAIRLMIDRPMKVQRDEPARIGAAADQRRRELRHHLPAARQRDGNQNRERSFALRPLSLSLHPR